MIYLICFTISLLLAHSAMKAKSRWLFVFFSILSISVTVWLAALRDYSIGIDVKNYMSYGLYWRGAFNSSSLKEYLVSYASRGGTEYLFVTFIGLIAQLTGDFRLFLLLAHVVIIVCVYIGAYRQKEYASPITTLFLFYLLFYNHSLNIIRQYMAMAIVFAFIKDIWDKKYKRFVFGVILASFIHVSAILSLGILGIYYILYEQSKFKNSSLARKFGICCVLIGVLVGIVPIVELLITKGILSTKYMFYLNSEDAVPTTIVSMLLIGQLIGVWLFRKSIKRQFQLSDLYIFSSIAYLFLQQTSNFMVFGKRIAAYYSLVNIITIGMLQKSQKGKASNYYIITGFMILIALVYWFYMYVYNGASQTFPYKFFFVE